MFVLLRLGGLVVVIGTVIVVVMARVLGGLMAGMAAGGGSMRMAPRCQQTVSQVQKNCAEGDDFEALAEHGLCRF